jgi:acyl-CoA reductase-like NAD-dependent aldehyde dehydrogenase
LTYPLDALGPDGEYRTRNREVITDAAGVPVAELSIAPPLFVARSLAAQRTTRPLPVATRAAALANTADIFARSVIAGLVFDDYIELTCRVSGLPLTVMRAGALGLADGLTTAVEAVEPARPRGATLDWRDTPPAGGAVWARRGEVFAVHAPGNAPGVHGLWPQALAMGYRVAVRPSRREPFTAHRLVHALRQAGFRREDAVYLPTDYAGAEELIRCADLAMVYGGQDVVDKYVANPTVLTNGPGRTKILITAEQDWREYLDVIVDSIAYLGGTACVSAKAVLYEGDPAPLAHAIADRLSSMPDVAPPTLPVDRARAVCRHLAAVALGNGCGAGRRPGGR